MTTTARHPARRVALALVPAVAGALLVACGGSGAEGTDAASRTDTLTRHQKDSLISTLPVPGAGAVGRALEAADRARDRAVAHDTIR